MTLQHHTEIFEIIQNDLENPRAIDRLAALLDAPDVLAEDPVFLAYCELPHIGPNNDWNGLRSAAMKLKRDWEFNVLAAAQAIKNKKRK